MNWPAAFGFSMILGAGVFGWVAGWVDGWMVWWMEKAM